MKKTNLAIATAVAMLSVGAQAAEVKMSGFVNAVMEANNVTEKNGGDVDYDANDKTKVGIQADIKINDELSATFQVVNRQNAWTGGSDMDDRETTVEYGFLAYKASDETTVRAGRLRTPFFLLSEYVEVGAIVPWNTAPSSVYHQMPTNAFDGVDILYNGQFGDTSYTAQAFYGNSDSDVYLSAAGFGANVDMANMYGGNVTLTRGDWTARFAYGKGDISFGVSPLVEMGIAQNIDLLTDGAQQSFAGAEQALAASEQLAEIDPAQSQALALQAQQLMDQGTELATQAGALNFLATEMPEQQSMSIMNLGLQGYVTENLTVMGEYAKVTSDHKIEGDDDGYYVAATYDFFNGFTVTGTYSAREENRVNDTQVDDYTEQMVTVSYDLGNNMLVRGEYRRTDGEYRQMGVVTNDYTTDNVSLSLNYVF